MSQYRSSQYRHRRSVRHSLFNFTRKPAFQFGVILLAVVIVALLVLTARNYSSSDPNAVEATAAQFDLTNTTLPGVVDVSTLYELYRSNSVYILDVRERSEWDKIHIPSTTLLPLGQVGALAAKMPTDKPIVVISDADDRATQARNIIKAAGILNVSSMADGIGVWKQDGYPVEP